jgi:phycocyanobilin:ferredoxin oxidoreductase
MALLHRCPCSLMSGGGGAVGTSGAGHRPLAAALPPHRRRPRHHPISSSSTDLPSTTDSSTPLTPEQLVALSERRAADQEAALRARLREHQRWEREGANGGSGADARGAEKHYWRAVRAAVRDLKFDEVPAMGEAGGTAYLADATNQFPAALAAEMVGLGTWRLRNCLDPAIEHAAALLEGLLREYIDDELGLYPPDKWKAKGWDYMDTEDPGNEKWGGWAHVDAPDPRRGEQGYPRLQVENRAYCSRAFRKLHLELARRQDGLNVLHAVFYPRLDFDLPIFALDLVAAGGTVTLAVVDCCPVRPGLALPPAYFDAMARLQREHLPQLFEQEVQSSSSSGGPPGMGTGGSRVIPDWGKDIFSPLCVCVRPRSGAELAGFIEYSAALCRAHLALAQASQPLNRTTKSGAQRLMDVAQAHKTFCDRQLANAKTARVLEAAFGVETTQRYMRELMFDFDPSDAPPWFDPALVRLHTHLTDTDPVPWSDLPQALALRQENMAGRSTSTLRGVATFGAIAAQRAANRGGPAGARLDEAVQWLVERDPNFRKAAATLGGVDLIRTTKEEEGQGRGGGGGGPKGRLLSDGLAEMLMQGAPAPVAAPASAAPAAPAAAPAAEEKKRE